MGPSEDIFDTDEEPLAKVAKFNTDCDTPYASPAVTLLRKKKRKRLINVQNEEEDENDNLDPEKRIKLKSPRTPRNFSESDFEETSNEDQIVEMSLQMTFNEWSNGNNTDNQRTSTPVSDKNPFINNTVKRKVTVIMNSPGINRDIECNKEILRDEINLDIYSHDSLDENLEAFDDDTNYARLELQSDSCSMTDTSSSSDNKYYSQEQLNNTGGVEDIGVSTNMEMLHFGEDYRLFISSLSDNSVTNDSKYRNKKLRRKNKRRQTNEFLPYESQSE